jgi:hypothetical protein
LTSTDTLRDPDLPAWFFMKHCILMATALDGWEKASYWVLAAQQCHHNNAMKAMREGDVVAQAALNMMRGWLDRLIEYKVRAMTGEIVPEGREKAIVEAYNRSFGGLTSESEPESPSAAAEFIAGILEGLSIAEVPGPGFSLPIRSAAPSTT